MSDVRFLTATAEVAAPALTCGHDDDAGVGLGGGRG
jgi:hypothetical protein